MKVSLVVLTAGKAAGQSIPVPSAQFIIGRDPQCNLRPASAIISKRHCAIMTKDGQLSLRDYDSTNGTFLNDEQVKGEVPIKDGDVLKVGPLSFKVEIVGAAAPSKPTPAPKPKTADIMDDDAAALLMDLDEEAPTSAPEITGETEDSVPGGTTQMDMPAIQEALAKIEPSKPATAKPEEKKKAATGAAQDAAKAILERLRQGRRK